MTFNETVRSLYDLSTAGHFNHEKFSFFQFKNYVKKLFDGNLKLGNKAVLEIALPDGWWLCEVIRFSEKADGWLYYIPENRDQEKRIWDALTA